MKNKIILPSKISTECWFYEQNKEQLEPYLGKYYVSYSTASGFYDYQEDFIKQKLAGIKLPDGVYANLGNFLGEAVQFGFFSEYNPHGFTGQENIDLPSLRPDGAEYEKLVIIDFGEWIFIGFADRYLMTEKGAEILDFKTGAANKLATYKSDKYTQVILYARARELSGDKIHKTGVYFIERQNSHIKPPLHLSANHTYIPLEYNKERVEYAVNKLKKEVEAISELYKCYMKFFKQ